MDTLQFPGPLTELEKLKLIAQELREADEDLREDLDEMEEADAARDSRLIDRANAKVINRG